MHPFQPAFYVGPHVAGAFLKPRGHIYFARRATIGRICPIRSARRLSSDALITGVAGGGEGISLGSAASTAFIGGNNNLRHRCRQARPGPLNPRTRAENGLPAEMYRWPRCTMHRVYPETRFARGRSRRDFAAFSTTFSAEPARRRSSYLQLPLHAARIMQRQDYINKLITLKICDKKTRARHLLL